MRAVGTLTTLPDDLREELSTVKFVACLLSLLQLWWRTQRMAQSGNSTSAIELTHRTA